MKKGKRRGPRFVRFDDLKIKDKLLTAFIVTIVIVIITGAVGYLGMNNIMGELKDVTEVRMESRDSLLTIGKAHAEINMAENMLLSSELSPEERQRRYDLITTKWYIIEEEWREYDKLNLDPEERRHWLEFGPIWNEWKEHHETFLEIAHELDATHILEPDQLRYVIAQRERDHVIWIRDLGLSVVDGREFHGETDPTKCALGRWMNSFKTENSQLNALLTELHGYHNTVHGSGQKIIDLLDEEVAGNAELAMEEYKTVTEPSMAKVLELLSEMDKVAAEAEGIYHNMVDYAIEYVSPAFVKASEKMDALESKSSQLADASTRQASDVARISYIILMITVIISIIAALILRTFVSNKIANPIRDIQVLMAGIGEGDLTIRGEVKTKDELGKFTEAFNGLIEKMHNMTSDVYETAILLNESSDELLLIADTLASNSEEMNAKTGIVSAAVHEITASIEGTAAASTDTSSNISVIASATEEMSATVRNLASASEETSVSVDQVSEVVANIANTIDGASSSLSQVATSVNSVATAVKELNISLTDVSKSCDRSIAITKDAEDQATDTNRIIEKLNRSSKQIGKIVNVINDIADQTNMLALNAAIEAAGAGEAGKGFAVVANEVKELAKQTAEATDEIGQQIEEMQMDMGDAVGAVETITVVIEEIDNITNAIASAVTEQSAITGEISNTIVGVAGEVNNVNGEIEMVAGNTRDAAKSLSEASLGVREIAKSSAELSTASNEIAENTEIASQKVIEVARSTDEISKGTGEIAENIEEITAASNETAQQAMETNTAASALSEQAENLERLVRQYKI
ncbi:MAG: methyl-accepting chemotaxis protein [Clostridiales bacterium]|nr:methyl-accepting chemotaxis protein [Clostridiales bacterium]